MSFVKVDFHQISRHANAVMPALEDTNGYLGSPPESDPSDLVPGELLPRGLAGSEIDSDHDRWSTLGINFYPRRSTSPQLEIYTLTTTEGEYLDNAQQRAAPGTLPPMADDRYRRSEGPPPRSPSPVVSLWQSEILFPRMSFASLATENEMDDVNPVPVGTLRPWSRCGWVPNQDEPEPELAEFFDQHRMLSISPPEFPMYVDFSDRITSGHPHRPVLSAPSSVDTTQDYVRSDDEWEEHHWALPTNTPRLPARF